MRFGDSKRRPSAREQSAGRLDGPAPRPPPGWRSASRARGPAPGPGPGPGGFARFDGRGAGAEVPGWGSPVSRPGCRASPPSSPSRALPGSLLHIPAQLTSFGRSFVDTRLSSGPAGGFLCPRSAHRFGLFTRPAGRGRWPGPAASSGVRSRQSAGRDSWRVKPRA